MYRSLGDLYRVGGLLVALDVSLALTYPGVRLRDKRARALAYWRMGLDIRRLARRARSVRVSRSEEDDLATVLALDDLELALVSRFEEHELERLRERWGAVAFQRAWSGSERYYRALSASFVPIVVESEYHQGRVQRRGDEQ